MRPKVHDTVEMLLLTPLEQCSHATDLYDCAARKEKQEPGGSRALYRCATCLPIETSKQETGEGEQATPSHTTLANVFPCTNLLYEL